MPLKANPQDPTDPVTILNRLRGQLVGREKAIDQQAAYYFGQHPLTFATDKFRDTFGDLFSAFADNWCEIVCNAPAERLEIQGFTVPDGEGKPNEAAQRIWMRNDLDLQMSASILSSMYEGAFYQRVWYATNPDGSVDENRAEITCWSAHQAIVEMHPRFLRQRRNALIVFTDDDGYEHAELWVSRPEPGVYLFRSTNKTTEGVATPSTITWEVEDMLAADGINADGWMRNPLGAIPVVEVRNRPALRIPKSVGWKAHSEIAGVIPLQNAVNKLFADLIIGSEFASFRQRWLTGYQGDQDPRTNQRRPPEFKPGAGTVWWLQDPNARFGSFDASDISQLVEPIGMVVNHIAAQSRTPQHYLSSSADRLSGESIRSAETSLVKKCAMKGTVIGVGEAEVMRLAALIENEAELAAAGTDGTLRPIWADMETRTESEHIDALTKKAQTLRVPLHQLWLEAGYDPVQIAAFPAQLAQEQLTGLADAAAQTAALGVPTRAGVNPAAPEQQ